MRISGDLYLKASQVSEAPGPKPACRVGPWLMRRRYPYRYAGCTDLLSAKGVFHSQSGDAPPHHSFRVRRDLGETAKVIKEGKQAVSWASLSCHRFRSNEVRLWLSVIASNLANFWRR